MRELLLPKILVLTSLVTCINCGVGRSLSVLRSDVSLGAGSSVPRSILFSDDHWTSPASVR